MKCSYLNWVFLLCSIFLLNACGSGSGSDSDEEEHPSFDLRGDWIMTVRHNGGVVSSAQITITSHNRGNGEFQGQGAGTSDILTVAGSIKWDTPPVDGPGLAVIEMRMFGGDPIFCPYTNSILGRTYSESEAYYIYAAEEVYSIYPNTYAPHTAYYDAGSKHRYQCSEIRSGGSVGHDVSITFVRATSPNDILYEIGDSGPAGGIVFFTSDGGRHGLEAAPEDQVILMTPSVEWGCFPTFIPGADETAVGTGAQNTADILAGCMDTPIAADVAAGYSLNGFSDWFLPSKEELNELYLNRSVVGGFASDSNGSLYWSSSEAADPYAWAQWFCICSHDGLQVLSDKNNSRRVRAVRAF